MNIHNITTADMNNGDGLRTVLWVSGCTHACKGCHNPCTWDVNDGIPFTQKEKQELFDDLNNDYIQGITFSGGDPLHPANRDEIGNLIAEVKKLDGKDIWLYTGYTFEEILKMDLEYLKDIDVLIDGEFIEELKDVSLKWRGSSNQRIINVKESLANGKIVLFCE